MPTLKEQNEAIVAECKRVNTYHYHIQMANEKQRLLMALFVEEDAAKGNDELNRLTAEITQAWSDYNAHHILARLPKRA